MKDSPPLLALDTNVVLRALVQDDPVQTEVAGRYFRRADAGEFRLFISTVVLCELEWVLESHYRLRRSEIVDAMESLLLSPSMEFEDHDAFTRSLAAYRAGKGDLSDYLILQAARKAGCPPVITFEKKLPREDGFKAA